MSLFNGRIISATLLNQRFHLAATTLITCDLIDTLEQEIRLVWFGTWGVPTALYFLNRYGVFVFAWVLLDVTVIRLPVLSVPEIEYSALMAENFFCEFWNSFGSWSIPIVMLLIEAMLLLRVFVMYEYNRKVLIAGWSLYVSCAIVSVVLIALDQQLTTPVSNTLVTGISSCNISASVELMWALWVPGLVMELTLVLFTCFRSLQVRELGITAPILTSLMRDGFLYFLCEFALIVVNIVVSLTTSFYYHSTIVELSLCISSILANRLFLNLRETAYRKQEARPTMEKLERLDSLESKIGDV